MIDESMGKLAHISIRGVTKSEFKKVLKDAGLKNKLFSPNTFSDESVSVNCNEINRPGLGTGISMGIHSESLERASEVYNSILEGKSKLEEGKEPFHTISNVHPLLMEYRGKK